MASKQPVVSSISTVLEVASFALPVYSWHIYPSWVSDGVILLQLELKLFRI